MLTRLETVGTMVHYTKRSILDGKKKHDIPFTNCSVSPLHHSTFKGCFLYPRFIFRVAAIRSVHKLKDNPFTCGGALEQDFTYWVPYMRLKRIYKFEYGAIDLVPVSKAEDIASEFVKEEEAFEEYFETD